jgi:dolichol-phosphate mannosyltransferase
MSNYVPKYSVVEFTPKSSNFLLVIPVINEGNRILTQLYNIRKCNLPIDIAIADGGSTDGSLDDRQLLKGLGVNYLLSKIGPGKLSAQLLTAFDYALKNDYVYAITMDGNNKDGVAGIDRIAKALLDGFDFVQGSRFVLGGEAIRTPRLRLLAIKLMHAPLTSLAAKRRYTDTTNGFRGFSSRLLSAADIDIFRPIFFSYELIFYLPIQAGRRGYSICEVPVTRSYPENEQVPTKIHGLLAYLSLIKVLIYAAIGKYGPNEER